MSANTLLFDYQLLSIGHALAGIIGVVVCDEPNAAPVYAALVVHVIDKGLNAVNGLRSQKRCMA